MSSCDDMPAPRVPVDLIDPEFLFFTVYPAPFQPEEVQISARGWKRETMRGAGRGARGAGRGGARARGVALTVASRIVEHERVGRAASGHARACTAAVVVVVNSARGRAETICRELAAHRRIFPSTSGDQTDTILADFPRDLVVVTSWIDENTVADVIVQANVVFAVVSGRERAVFHLGSCNFRNCVLGTVPPCTLNAVVRAGL